MTRQRQWQLKHKRAGLCLRCSKKAIAGSQLCRQHRELQRESQIRWRAREKKPPQRKPPVKSRGKRDVRPKAKKRSSSAPAGLVSRRGTNPAIEGREVLDAAAS